LLVFLHLQTNLTNSTELSIIHYAVATYMINWNPQLLQLYW